MAYILMRSCPEWSDPVFLTDQTFSLLNTWINLPSEQADGEVRFRVKGDDSKDNTVRLTKYPQNH